MRRRPSNAEEEDEEADDSSDTPIADPTVVEWNESDKGYPSSAAADAFSDNRLLFSGGRAIGPHTIGSPTPEARIARKQLAGAREVYSSAAAASAGASRRAMHDVSLPGRRRPRLRSPWFCSFPSLVVTLLSSIVFFACIYSFFSRQTDPAGCRMSYMRPAFAKLTEFDTEHTRFASKYSIYLYREGGVDEDTRVKGVPVLFIPGNAGSYKQVRPIAAEAAQYFHDVVQHDAAALQAGSSSLDFFTVDFNEDITAFHGQTLLDQAEYLNEAVAYILSLYHDPRRSMRAENLPDPTSVILVGHSMGGIVARTMLTLPNYQSNSINTIVTMSAPHARPPVAFDGDIVRTYERINDYWRRSYSQKWANNNPLWHVTLVSVAGGGLDTVIPSDYASLASLVPDTHGFTVFTSSVPAVWTGMDHQAILWCDQFRKVLVRLLMEVVNVKRPGQTKPRADRMRIMKKWLLTGMEPVTDKTLPYKEATTILTLGENSTALVSQTERFVLKKLGESGRTRAHLLPVPPNATPGGKRFTLLTSQALQASDGSSSLEVLFCSVFPLQVGHSATLFSMDMDLARDSSGSTRLGCKNAAGDVIRLPASTVNSKYPFDDVSPFYYFEYDVEDIMEHQFVAVVDKATEPTTGWVVAEFSDKERAEVQTHTGLASLLFQGLRLELPAQRALVTNIKIPTIHSGLLAYRLRVNGPTCSDAPQLFQPFLRQYLNEPYESKYFVNVTEADLNLHGQAPFMPPPLRQQGLSQGLSLQIWLDPSCHDTVGITLDIDAFGSLGKLVVRYRTVFAAFPLMVVALVLSKQFSIYDTTGVFVSFAEALDLCLRRSIPVVFVALSICAVSVARTASQTSRPAPSGGTMSWRRNATESAVDFTKNDLLLGSQDPFFWFLVPAFGLISVGACVVLNYAALVMIHVFSVIYGIFKSRRGWIPNEGRRQLPASNLATSSLGRRVVTASILLLLVSTVIPYQFAFLVACIVQITTCIRALRLARETRLSVNLGFYNYAHSLLVLMIWVLPINMPVLLVWIHNLTVHWLTPFSSHHNVFSVMPLIFLVETVVCGHMIPRILSRLRYITQAFFLFLAMYAALYGVSYAYMLHHLVNLIAAWLVAVHYHPSITTSAGSSSSSSSSSPSSSTPSSAPSASGNGSSIRAGFLRLCSLTRLIQVLDGGSEHVSAAAAAAAVAATSSTITSTMGLDRKSVNNNLNNKKRP